MIRTVADVMEEALVVPGSMTLQDVSARMLDAGVEAAVVADERNPCGLITAEAVAKALLDGHDPRRIPVEAVADHDPPLARANEALAEVHQRMRGSEQPLAVVVSRNREPLGLLSDPKASA